MNKIEIDKDWLYQKYIIEKMSMKEIAQLLGISDKPIRNRLKEYNIPSRKQGSWQEKSPIILNSFQKEVIQGALLGDGSLTSGRKNSSFVYISKVKEHVQFVCHSLEDYAIPSCFYSESDVYDYRTNKKYHKTTFKTQANITFTQLRDKWYKNNIKHIPNDLKLTSTNCLIWYLGDGSLTKYSTKSSQRIYFATNSFMEEEIQDILIPQLKDFEPTIQLNNRQPVLFIPRRKILDFLNFIGPCPVEAYRHKWDYVEYSHEPLSNNPDKISKIILAYKNGSNPNAIATYFGIDRSTVIKCLKDNNIDINLNRYSQKKICFD